MGFIILLSAFGCVIFHNKKQKTRKVSFVSRRRQVQKGQVPHSRSHSWHSGLPASKALCATQQPLPPRPTFRLRMLEGLASDLSMTWMSWSTSSPEGRGRVTSSATSLAASSSWRKGRAQAVSNWGRAALGSSAMGSHSPAAGARLAACTSSRPGPHQSWPDPPSPPQSSTPPGCNAA